MSIGHRPDDLELDASSLQELYEALGSEDTPRLFDQDYVLNTDYDIAFAAGSSIDRKTKYIDRTLFSEVMRGDYNKTGLSPQQIIGLWCDHEQAEGCIIDGNNAVDTYIPAHKRALALEHRIVLSILGKDDDAKGKIEQYEGVIWPGIERAYKPPQNAPADLYCAPLVNDPDDQDEAILKRLVELGVKDAGKRSKYMTRYGMAKHRCDKCRHWSPEVLSDEQGQLAACRVVSGLVRNDRGCDFWMDRMSERPFHPTHIGGKQAPDGHWYVPDGSRKGKFLRVDNA